MSRLLFTHGAASRYLQSRLLDAMIRIHEDLHNLLVTPSKQRLAGVLLRLANPAPALDKPGHLPKIGQQMLADLVGTTRFRINYFMRRFRKTGFIVYNGGLQINNSPRSVAQRE